MAASTSNSVGAATASLLVTVRKMLSRNFMLDLSLELPPGVTILFGPSGAGKTTVLDCVAGLCTPDEGRIALNGRVLFDSATGVNVPVSRRRTGYVFQDLALFPHLTAIQNIEYGLAHLEPAERQSRVQAIAESFRIRHLLSMRPGELSGGERQRVAVARALVTDPCVLLLDEPLTGLDRPTRSRLLDDLRAWNDAHQVPVLYITHSREEVFALGERVVVLEKGRVLAQGSPYEVLHAPLHELTAELTGVENLLDATITALHEREGTMSCELGEASVGRPQIEVPLARNAAVGGGLRVGIRAGDILLANARPEGLSARNLLAGRIVSLHRRDVTVVAMVDCGVELEVHVTPAAQQSLGLQVGREVWLVIKTYSCHLLR